VEHAWRAPYSAWLAAGGNFTYPQRRYAVGAMGVGFDGWGKRNNVRAESMKSPKGAKGIEMVKRIIYVSIVSIFGVLGWSLDVSATTTECEGASLVVQGKLLDSLEKLITASTIVVQAEVTAAEALGSQQKIAFRVLQAWKGPFHVGESVNLTLPVTDFCGGLGCVFPFKVGEVTLLSTSSFSYHLDQPGCWVYEGIAIQRVLLVPAALMPNPRH
jgi:hypothetical protein